MNTFKVYLEDTLDHCNLLFESESIVAAWKEWYRLWTEGPDVYDLGLELAMQTDQKDYPSIITLYYEEWNNEQES